MRTEAEVKERLKEVTKERRTAQKRFEKYDNHEDMEILAEKDCEIAVLKWVVGACVGG